MAIFSKTQFPKYQSPIRITRPYIKPNYLADTINSAIQGYGSIQGMNMQQQLFNAKLKAAQDAKAQNELDQATQRQYLMGVDAGAQPARTDIMNLQGGDPYGIAGIPAYSQGALNQTYQYDTPAVPGASSMDSLRAAMQANPNADPIQLMRVAQAYSALQPKPAKGMSAAMAYRIGRDEKTDANKVIAGDKKLKTRRGTTVTTLLGEEFGSLLEGTDAEIAARFEPSTKPIIGERTWDRPETWGFGDREIGTVTTGESGPLKLRAFVGRRVRDMAMWMLNNNYDESDVKIVMARMKEAGMASGKFDFVAAWGAVPSEIAENIGQRGGQQQAQGSVSQREANLNITRM